jgi:hypothetical protein
VINAAIVLGLAGSIVSWCLEHQVENSCGNATGASGASSSFANTSRASLDSRSSCSFERAAKSASMTGLFISPAQPAESVMSGPHRRNRIFCPTRILERLHIRTDGIGGSLICLDLV